MKMRENRKCFCSVFCFELRVDRLRGGGLKAPMTENTHVVVLCEDLFASPTILPPKQPTDGFSLTTSCVCLAARTASPGFCNCSVAAATVDASQALCDAAAEQTMSKVFISNTSR